MNQKVLLASLALFLCTACFNHETHADESLSENEFRDFEIKYASGFSLHVSEESRFLIIHDPETGINLDTLNLKGSTHNMTRYFKRIIAQSTTHFAFLNQIQVLDNLIGLCGIQYLSEDQKMTMLNTTEVCNAQGLDIEKIVSLSPDLVFVYPFGDKDKSKLNQLGLRTVYLTEYMEKSPLARAEWLKFFALISGQNPNETGFEAIEQEYLSLIQEPRTTKNLTVNNEVLLEWTDFKSNFNLPRPNTVAFNLPFGDVWDMPDGNSISATLVRDAGLDYFLKNEKESGNLIFKLEEAYAHLSRAHYWVIIAARPANFSMTDLLTENRVYKNFASVQLKTVIFCNTETTPYFSQGPIEPHILLRDLVNCIAGRDNNNKYFKLLR